MTPYIVGLTGGIGSGKTTVAKVFERQGIPVFYADVAAKTLMNTDQNLKGSISELFGQEAYLQGALNTGFLAGIVFQDSQKLSQLNRLVHPAVQKYFKEWAMLQSSPYVIEEAAILFESGSYKFCRSTIVVTAPLELRIERVMRRDGISRKDVLNRMKYQWDDALKVEKADFVVRNEPFIDEKEALKIHYKLLEMSGLQRPSS